MLTPEWARRFTGLQLLGRGGMGEVFAARDLQLNREVAIKVMRGRAGDDSTFRARFKREMRVMARVVHPNVVKVLDVCLAPENLCLVMEYVPGLSLDAWAAKKGRDWRAIVRVFVDLADALAALHESGVLHRDLKPRNVLVLEDGTPKLLDFGLVLPLGELDLTRLTDVDHLVGTLCYSAPEILLGLDASERSDVYSLGVSLHECLTGKVPIEPPQLMELLRRRFAMEPPSSVAPPAGVPSAVADVVKHALELQPEHRLPNAAAFRVALRAALPSSVVASRSSVEPAQRSAAVTPARPRSRRPSAVLPAVAMLVLAGLFVFAAREPRPSAPPSVRAARAAGPRVVAGPFVYPSSDAADVDVVVDRALGALRAGLGPRELQVRGPVDDPAGKRYSVRVQRGQDVGEALVLEGAGPVVRVKLGFGPRAAAATPATTRPIPRIRELQAAAAALPPEYSAWLVSSLPACEQVAVEDDDGPWRPRITAGPALLGDRLAFGDAAGRLLVAPCADDQGFAPVPGPSADRPLAVAVPCWVDGASNYGEVVDVVDGADGVAAYACRTRCSPRGYQQLTNDVRLRPELDRLQAGLPLLPCPPEVGARFSDLLLLVPRAGPARAREVAPYPPSFNDRRSYRPLPTLLGRPLGRDLVVFLHQASRVPDAAVTLAVASVAEEPPGRLETRILGESLGHARGGPQVMDGLAYLCCRAESLGAGAGSTKPERELPETLWVHDSARSDRAWSFLPGRTLREGLFALNPDSGFLVAASARALYLLDARQRGAMLRADDAAASGPLGTVPGEATVGMEQVRFALGPGAPPEMRFVGTPLPVPPRPGSSGHRLFVLMGVPRGNTTLQRTFDLFEGPIILHMALYELEVRPEGLRVSYCAGPFKFDGALGEFTSEAGRPQPKGLGLMVVGGNLFVVDPGREPADALVLHHDHGAYVSRAVLHRNVVYYAAASDRVYCVAFSPTRLGRRR